MNYKLFVDLDGVLTDFEKAKSQAVDPEGIWEDVDFWTKMPWMSDGKQLWNYIKSKEPTILSSPGRKTNYRVMRGKDEWIDEQLGSLVKRIFEVDKALYAKENYILIDDKNDNISEWKTENGLGILHTSTANTIIQLKKLGL